MLRIDQTVKISDCSNQFNKCTGKIIYLTMHKATVLVWGSIEVTLPRIHCEPQEA